MSTQRMNPKDIDILVEILNRFPREWGVKGSKRSGWLQTDLTRAQRIIKELGRDEKFRTDLFLEFLGASELALETVKVMVADKAEAATPVFERLSRMEDYAHAFAMSLDLGRRQLSETDSDRISQIRQVTQSTYLDCLDAAKGNPMATVAIGYAKPRHISGKCSVKGCWDACDHEPWQSRRTKRIIRELGLETNLETN